LKRLQDDQQLNQLRQQQLRRPDQLEQLQNERELNQQQLQERLNQSQQQLDELQPARTIASELRASLDRFHCESMDPGPSSVEC
jgi:hypothetical protein